VVAACHNAASGDVLIQPYHCDVTNKSQVEGAIAGADKIARRAVSSTSSVASILVNCAGITRDARLTNLSNEDWDDVLNVNLKGTFLMCQQFCKTERIDALLSPTGGTGGSIINIGSIISNYGNIGQVNYAASKGGVVGLTRALAKEMALLSRKSATSVDHVSGNEYAGVKANIPPSVRVNCIQPGKYAVPSTISSLTVNNIIIISLLGIGYLGLIASPMLNKVPEKIRTDMTSKVALRRLGRPEDVANLVLFLASNERSGYITGETFECSGMSRL
jgi:NAD(P)-dependent dehydrogenase (short-subunit alcohol dehydrogenase family)